MLEQTVYLAALFKGLDDTPQILHFSAAIVPALLLGISVIKANKFLAAVGFTTLHALFFVGLLKLTEGGYAFWLYSLCQPLHQTDWTGLVAPSLADQFMIYGLPALVHGLTVPLLSLLIGVGVRAARKN
ncbi:hypothetical protein [Desulfovibrio ferrophilus]|uniref:Uncharacterized protein n=1 Tax=Desulfovibrio ferrophilus TaxID=241368 RepID=A0A2Z6AZZ7_9BACT|nr:hypothetical protein [Desulfovibrio ferrophilus]BBD08829.1 putative uncharacterized protein [Desulfovibrio ferrophilus]